MRVFVTGFGPFGNVQQNPSGELAGSCGHPYAVLETSFEAVDQFIDSFPSADFDALLMIGVAANSKVLRLEKSAHNQIGDAADVRGIVREGTILEDGSEQLSGTLWHRGDARRPGCRWSNHAGTYLCNYIYYRALSSLPHLKAGFLHIPQFSKMAEAEQLARLQSLITRISAR